MHWNNLTFNQLDINMLYDILRLRVDVFVVEQAVRIQSLTIRIGTQKPSIYLAYRLTGNCLPTRAFCRRD